MAFAVCRVGQIHAPRWFCMLSPRLIVFANYLLIQTAKPRKTQHHHVRTARQLKALNGSSSIYFYLNTMMDWEQYSLHSWIAKNHPDWWVTNERNDTVCLDGQPLFNLTLPEVRAHWVGVAAKAMKTGLYDGVFADRANALPKGDQRQPGPGQAAANGIWTLVQNSSGSNGPSVYSCISPPDGRPPYQYSAQAYDEWAVGHAALYRDLQHAVGRDNVVVANNNNSDAANGRQFERWCNNDYDKRTIIQDVADLEQAGRNKQTPLSNR